MAHWSLHEIKKNSNKVSHCSKSQYLFLWDGNKEKEWEVIHEHPTRSSTPTDLPEPQRLTAWCVRPLRNVTAARIYSVFWRPAYDYLRKVIQYSVTLRAQIVSAFLSAVQEIYLEKAPYSGFIKEPYWRWSRWYPCLAATPSHYAAQGRLDDDSLSSLPRHTM